MSHHVLLTVSLVLASSHTAMAQECNRAAMIAGSIFGTIGFIGLIIGIIALVYYFRKQKDKKNLEIEKAKLANGQENQAFVGDLESGGGVSNNRTISPNKEKDFPGYVECKEYESPIKYTQAGLEVPQNGGAASARVLFPGEKPERMRPVQKTGSSGSLDNNYPADSDVFVVPLLSHDIMGLGFNVDGNMKEGIFVSKLLKRGPAHDAGVICVGDRIMSVTISFENMVLEDAMTILSYASPYPVKLCLKRNNPSSPKSKVPDVQIISNPDDPEINHPVFRSQSLDDLRHINQDGLPHPRRTWSEWKKQGYLPVGQDQPSGNNSLKKWKGKNDIVEESENGDIHNTQTNSSASNESISELNDVDMKLNMDFESDFQQTRAQIEKSYTEIDMDAPDGQVTLSTEGAAFRSDDNKRHMEHENEIGVGILQLSKKLKLEAEGSSDEEVILDRVKDGVPTEKPPAVPDTPPNSDQETNQSDSSTVGDVIRDYFGNSPSILHQFGLKGGDDDICTDIKTDQDGTMTTITRTETVETANGKMTTTVVESSQMITADDGFVDGKLTANNGVVRTSTSSNSLPSSRSASPSPNEEDEVQSQTSNSTFTISSLNIPKIDKKPDTPKPPGHKGGVAYYYNIEGPPSLNVLPLAGSDLKSADERRPDLIRPENIDREMIITKVTTSVNSYEVNDTIKDWNDNSQNMKDFKSSPLTVQLDNDNSQNMKDFKSSPLTVQLDNDNIFTGKPTRNLETKTESITIIRQSEVPEAFTVTLNDSDA